MESQNERIHHTSGYLLNSGDDVLAFFQSYFTKVEFRSYIFYLIQMLEMFLITVISTLVFISSHKNDDLIHKLYHNFLSKCYISPSIFDVNTIPYLIIGTILFLIFLFIIYTIYLGYIIKKDDNTINPNIVKPWIIIKQLVLPIPGYLIGSYFGYYFLLLTKKIYISQLFLIITVGIFWSWLVISSNILYSSYHFKRNNDISQIHHNYYLFDSFITIIPMIQTILPYVITVFISSSYKYIIYTIITSIISIFVIIFDISNHAYYNDSMNQFIVFLFLIKMPISYIWSIDETNPTKLKSYLVFNFLFITTTFILIKLISKYYLKCNQIQSNDQISIESQEEISIENSKDQSIQIFDPFINFPYPFNLVSLTKQDIILGVYLSTSIVSMILFNGLAATRMPISKALPDIIQEHFYVADYLRTNVNSSFEISNILVLIQIALLIIFFLIVPQYLNVRRFVFIYGTLCYIRTISFTLTTLPAPCTGAPKCPCSDPEIINRFRNGNPIKIAFTWLFGLGMFLKLPQCGDLIISGHTMWLWLTSRTLCSVMEYVIPRPFNLLSIALLMAFTLIAMAYIVLSKNHYSIDVWFAFLITELLFTAYNSLAENSVQQRPNWSLCQKIIRFIETRPPKRILMQTKMLMQYK